MVCWAEALRRALLFVTVVALVLLDQRSRTAFLWGRDDFSVLRIEDQMSAEEVLVSKVVRLRFSPVRDSSREMRRSVRLLSRVRAAVSAAETDASGAVASLCCSAASEFVEMRAFCRRIRVLSRVSNVLRCVLMASPLATSDCAPAARVEVRDFASFMRSRTAAAPDLSSSPDSSSSSESSCASSPSLSSSSSSSPSMSASSLSISSSSSPPEPPSPSINAFKPSEKSASSSPSSLSSSLSASLSSSSKPFANGSSLSLPSRSARLTPFPAYCFPSGFVSCFLSLLFPTST